MTELTPNLHSETLCSMPLIGMDVSGDDFSKLIAEELKLEEEMLDEGIRRFRKGTQKSLEAGRAADTAGGQAFIAQCVNAVSQGIEEFLLEASSGKAGRRHHTVKLFNEFELNPEACAYIALKVIFSIAHSESKTVETLKAIGSAIEDEARYRAFKKAKPGYVNALLTDLQMRTQNPSHKRKVLITKMQHSDVQWDFWSEKDKIKMGEKLLDIIIRETGRVEVFIKQEHSQRKVGYVRLTEDTHAWIDKRHDFLELQMPARRPMIVPPLDWSGATGGGYLSERIRPINFVLTRSKEYLQSLGAIREQMQPHYQAVNAIQRTAWRINKPVLDVLRDCISRGVTLDVLPSREPVNLPKAPADYEANSELHRAWKNKIRDIKSKYEPARQRKCRKLDSILSVAIRYQDYEKIYFPHNCDFRGRVYCVPQILNPQGEDVAKALLTFAEGKPIETTEQANWLAIHGANVFGFDKASMQARVRWVNEHEDEIIAAAGDPIQNRFWTKADRKHRWQALAFCFEWAAFRKQGLGFVSHLPIYVDGTCNGLQHYSAMLRDETGGAAVNLIPSEKPSDIYGLVAEVATKHLGQIANGENFIETDKLIKPEQTALAKAWLKFGITRSICKTPVMTLPYGATLYACKKAIQDHMKQEVGLNATTHSTLTKWSTCNFLGAVVWQAIGEVVVKAREAMDCLQNHARQAAKEQYSAQWTSPTGFPVVQQYRKTKSKRLDTFLGGGAKKRLRIDEELPQLNVDKHANSIAPNFVHSLDAAALCLTVNKATSAGLTSFGMIHDAYGCPAADMPVLTRTLRESFIEMYSTDVLGDLLAKLAKAIPQDKHNKLTPLPKKGSLDITQVLESEYFFG